MTVLLPAFVVATTLSSVAVVAAFSGAVAGAEPLPPYPGITYPSGAFNSRCAQMSLSGGPNVLQFGQVITASAGPPTDQCGGPADHVSWVWAGGAGVETINCRPNAATCKMRADQPTSQWNQVCILGGSVFGGWSSCGLVIVLGKGTAVIDGYVKTAAGQGVAGADVTVSGPSGGTAATGQDGYYAVTVTPGAYTATIGQGGACSASALGPTTAANLVSPGRLSPAAAAAPGRLEQPDQSTCPVPMFTFTPHSDGVSVGDGQTVTVNFLAVDQQIQGTVVDEQGKPQVGLTVTLASGKGAKTTGGQTTITDGEGKYKFALLPGTYTVAPQLASEDDEIANGYRATACPGGSVGGGACNRVPLPREATRTVNFLYGCGLDGDDVDKVEPLAEGISDQAKFGGVPFSSVTLSGKGFCPDMTVEFGNDQSVETVTDKDGTDITDSGEKAVVDVPKLATSGPLTVTSADQEVTLDNVPIDSFRNVYGFSFPNFSLKPAYLTPQMFEHVFGVANTTQLEPQNTCAPASCTQYQQVMTPQAANYYISIVNDFGINGVCFGMALAAARLAQGGDLTPADLGQDAARTWDISKDASVVQFLAQQQLVQYSTQFGAERTLVENTNTGKTRDQILGEIEAAVGSDTPKNNGEYGNGALIEMFENAVVKGKPVTYGHAVLAYYVETDSFGAFNGHVDVYNPNVPYTQQEETVTGGIHALATGDSQLYIGPDGRWSFPQLDWSGAPDELDVVPYSELAGLINGGLTFNNPSGVSGNAAPGTDLSSLTAPDGKQVNLAGGSQEVVMDPITGGLGAATPAFFGPYGTYRETLTGTSGVGETLQWPGFQASISASGGRDNVTIDVATGSVTVAPATGAAASSSATVTVYQDTSAGGLQSAAVTGSPRTGPMTVGIESGAPVISASAHRARDLSVALSNQVTGTPVQNFNSSLALGPGDTATFNPSWSTFTGGPMTATVETPAKTTKSETFKNHAPVPAEPRLRQFRVSGHYVSATMVLPVLPSGSTATLTISFLDGTKLEHQVKATLKGLARASTRTVQVRIPAGLHAGSTAVATLVAVTGGTAATVVTSTLTINVGGRTSLAKA
jgi:hypothetical protein